MLQYKHKDLSSCCRPLRGMWTDSSLFWPLLRSPQKMTVWDKHPTKDRLCESASLQQKEFPVHQWSKKCKSGLIRKGKRNSLTFTYITPPSRQHSLGPREILAHDFIMKEESKNVWVPCFSAKWDSAKRLIFSHHIQHTEFWASWLKKSERAADNILRGHYREADRTNCTKDTVKKRGV